MTARVFIVEGHPVLRGAMRIACQDSPALEVVGEAAEGQDALIASGEVDPDVIVIDVELQDMDWFEVVRELKARRPASKFLALIRAADDRTLFVTFSAAVDGVVEKATGVKSIVDAVERIAGGSRVFSPEHERRAMRELGRIVRSARESTRMATLLTTREIEVLQLLAQGMTHQVVARRLRISPRTVETHVRKTYRKLGVHNRVEATHIAEQKGWL